MSEKYEEEKLFRNGAVKETISSASFFLLVKGKNSNKLVPMLLIEVQYSIRHESNLKA